MHVCITLTFDIQMSICYQNGRLKNLKGSIFCFKGTYFHFYRLARSIESMTTCTDYFTSYITGLSI